MTWNTKTKPKPMLDFYTDENLLRQNHFADLTTAEQKRHWRQLEVSSSFGHSPQLDLISLPFSLSRLSSP
jgi:hypothetical protein